MDIEPTSPAPAERSPIAPRNPAAARRSAFRGALCFALAGALLAGCAGAGGVRLNAAERMMWATYPLVSETAIGTCFIIGAKSRSAPGGVAPVVLTSSHIVRSARKGSLYLPVRVLGADGELALAVIRVRARKTGSPRQVIHPRFDIAAFELRVPPELARRLVLPLPLDEKMLATAGAAPRAGEGVAFAGYPEGLPGTLDLFPVLRSGVVASYDPLGAGARAFLVNGDVYAGDSGAPVFVRSRARRPVVAGMVIRRIGLGGGQSFPLALAVDSSVIRETLDLLAHQPNTNP